MAEYQFPEKIRGGRNPPAPDGKLLSGRFSSAPEPDQFLEPIGRDIDQIDCHQAGSQEEQAAERHVPPQVRDISQQFKQVQHTLLLSPGFVSLNNLFLNHPFSLIQF